jgi:hypothetical protein
MEKSTGDDDSVLERIKDILNTPLPGTAQAESGGETSTASGWSATMDASTRRRSQAFVACYVQKTMNDRGSQRNGLIHWSASRSMAGLPEVISTIK